MMIPTKPHIRSKSPLWTLYTVSILAVPLWLSGATPQSLPGPSEVEQKRNKENVDHTLGCLIGTRNTYMSTMNDQIDHNLRHHIASFAEAQTSHEFAIDFLTHATIIPKSWGKVCDIKRSPDGSLKVLTWKDTHILNPDHIQSSFFIGLMGAFFAMLSYSNRQFRTQRAVNPGSYNKGFTAGAVLGSLSFGIISSTIAYAIATSSQEVPGDLNRENIRGIPAIKISIYDLKSHRRETTITIKKSNLRVSGKTHAYFLDTIQTIGVSIYTRETRTHHITTFHIEPSGKIIEVDPPLDPESRAIRKSHLARLLDSSYPANQSEWGNYWNPQRNIYLPLSLGISMDLITNPNFDPSFLTTLDEHEPNSYAIRHGISRHVLHTPFIGYEDRTIAHVNLMKITGIKEGISFLAESNRGQSLRVTLNKFKITNNQEQTITERIHLPRMISPQKIYAPVKSADSNAVVLKISKQLFNAGNADEPDHVTVILDLKKPLLNGKKQSLSPQLNIMIENIIKSGSSEEYDKAETSKFSLWTLGASWRKKILKNLRYFYNVDKERLAARKVSVPRVKKTVYGIIGAMALGILYNKCYKS